MKSKANPNQLSFFDDIDVMVLERPVAERPKAAMTVIAKAVAIQVKKAVFVLKDQLDSLDTKSQKLTANLAAIKLVGSTKKGQLSEAQKSTLVRDRKSVV